MRRSASPRRRGVGMERMGQLNGGHTIAVMHLDISENDICNGSRRDIRKGTCEVDEQ
jgi:hypothetical protein